jgi:chorismate dehydratase
MKIGMKTFSITATSYLNTLPFVYGIEKSGELKNYVLELDVPAVCAERIRQGNADIGLIPVAMLPQVTENYKMLDKYCLGAHGKVKSVLLLSQVPLGQIKDIYLDFESRTSVRLVTILAEHYWKLKDINWRKIWNNEQQDYSYYESLVAIGDKTFALWDKFSYKYDLAEEWYKFTSLPFVFACWVVKNDVPGETIVQLEKALQFGLINKLEAVREYKSVTGIDIDLEEYVEKYMNYDFDKPKHEALKLFLSYLK